MDFRLVVDSCCERSPLLKPGTRRVPLTMTLGETMFTDDEALDALGFLRRMRGYPGRAMSSCPAPRAYAAAFSDKLPTFVVTLSSQLSGSYASALAAKEFSERDNVYVIDSKTASAGELLVALKVQELAARESDPAEVVKKTEAFRARTQTIFVLEDVDNLVKNGRMSRISGTVASALRLRPILGADSEGNILLLDKARGTRNAVEKLCGRIRDECGPGRGRGGRLMISHCENPEAALWVERFAREQCEFLQVAVVKTGGLSSMYANRGGVITAFDS